MSTTRAAAPWIRIDETGAPYVEARRCGACEATLTRASLACPACGARDSATPFRASTRGTLYSWSIVARSFPGVATPFISAVVDLDDGVVLKGNLRGVAAIPEALSFGMPVQVVFDDALGRTDAEGNAYVSYFFEPLMQGGAA